MNEEHKPSAPGNDDSARIPAFAWLILAFVPSVVGLFAMLSKTSSPALGTFALILAVVCCGAAGIGLLSKMKDVYSRCILGLFLGGVFFVLNAIIVIFVGCSQMRF